MRYRIDSQTKVLQPFDYEIGALQTEPRRRLFYTIFYMYSTPLPFTFLHYFLIYVEYIIHNISASSHSYDYFSFYS